jgi:hypothetical protein
MPVNSMNSKEMNMRVVWCNICDSICIIRQNMLYTIGFVYMWC